MGDNRGLMTLTPLGAAEARVLGVLLEKEATTPEVYPLSVNSIQLGCNQKTARDPVMDLSEGSVHGALRELAQRGWVVREEGPRVTKWRHVLDRALGLESRDAALLQLLILRGPQTTGELRARSDRSGARFASVAEVEDVLGRLHDRSEPLVEPVPRQPGQKESRWHHLLGEPFVERPISDAVRRYESDEPEDLATRVADLNRRVAELERVTRTILARSEKGEES